MSRITKPAAAKLLDGKKELQIDHDAWKRFDAAIDKLLKAQPQHRSTKKKPNLFRTAGQAMSGTG